MALLGRILLFILLLLLIITVGASLYAKPQFFAKELIDIPTNEWNLTNYKSAIKEGQKLCRQISA